MRILIYGAGAVGSVLGGFLAEGGHDVTLLGRSWHLDAIRKQGLLLEGIWGTHRVNRFVLAVSPGQIERPDAFDWVFLCVKSHQTAAACADLPRLLGGRSLVAAFQNGLGNYEALKECVPADRLVLGRVIFGAEIQPGKVFVSVNADDVRIGSPSAGVSTARLEELAQALRASSIPTQVSASIWSVIWSKVLYNCALNGLSMLFEVPYGALLEQEQTRALMRRIIDEAYAVAAACRVSLSPAEAQAYAQLLFSKLIPDTARHHSSMLQDIRRARATEIEALNGAIVRLGRQAGIAAPANELVTRLVHEKERLASCQS